MKISRFLGMAALALLVVGAMGTLSGRLLAQTSQAPAPAQVTATPEPGPAGTDTDAVDQQVGDQNGPDGQEAADATDVTAGGDVQAQGGAQEGAESPGTEPQGQQDEHSAAYIGSIVIDPATTQGLNEADESAALAKLAKITTEEANTAALAANAGATVVKTTLQSENGTLVYGVELSTGVEVQVDAGNGAILATETGDGH